MSHQVIVEGLPRTEAETPAVRQEAEFFAVLMAPRGNTPDIGNIPLDIPLQMKAVEKVGGIPHRTDRPDPHIDRGPDINFRKAFLDYPCNG